MKFLLNICLIVLHIFSSECANDSTLIEENGPYHTAAITRNDFYQAYLALTMEETISVAHKPEEMVIFCMVGGIPMMSPYCNDLITGSVKMFAPTYGVCYVFNFKDPTGNVPPLRTNYAGRDFGLELIINIESKIQCSNSI